MKPNEKESSLLIEYMNKASTANKLAIEALEKGREIMNKMKSVESPILNRLEAIEARLSSIEKLLSAESKPPTADHSCRRCNDAGEINVLIPHTMADSEDIPCPDCSYSNEPEWRPMSEAPRDGRCIKVTFNYAQDEFFARFNGMWICTRGLEYSKGEYKWYFTDEDLSGWRPL